MSHDDEHPGWVVAFIALLALLTLAPVFYVMAEGIR